MWQTQPLGLQTIAFLEPSRFYGGTSNVGMTSHNFFVGIGGSLGTGTTSELITLYLVPLSACTTFSIMVVRYPNESEKTSGGNNLLMGWPGPIYPQWHRSDIFWFDALISRLEGPSEPGAGTFQYALVNWRSGSLLLRRKQIAKA